jgi:diguanylate cyclase (GGDEF)-like protein
LLTQRPPRDAPKREQLEYWLGHFGQIDLLTELPNRSQFLDRLSGAMARAIRGKQLVGVMLLNLDHFKALNAKYGHQVADLVLKKLAERLKDCTRKSDTVARLGGDEFAVILEGLTEKEGAAIATERLLKALGRPLQLESGEIAVTATVGVAFFPTDADNVDTLLQNADIAMCHAREHNRNTCQFYSPEFHLSSGRDKLRRAKIEKGLASLTPREREVLQILVAGNANKMIAYMLGTSTRTIENHRAKIMDKMDASSLPELVRMVVDVQGAATSPTE